MTFKIHEDANRSTYIFVRVYILVLLLFYILFDDFVDLSAIDPNLFYAHGVMSLFPRDWAIHLLGTPLTYIIIKFCLLLYIVKSIFDKNEYKSARYLFYVIILFTIYLGIEKGFGGHVNHRELPILYMLIIILFLEYGIKVNPNFNYQSALILLLSIIAIEYFYIACARIFMGFPTTFYVDTMETWIDHRNIRPNPYNLDIVYLVKDHWLYRTVTMLAIPVSTLLEFIPLLLLFTNKKRLLYIGTLLIILMHLGILLLMNILFLENIFLMLLFLPITNLVNKLNRLFIREGIIYYDGECALCDSYISYIIKNDSTNRFRFAPLGGAHAQKSHNNKHLMKPHKDSGSIVFESKDGVIYDRSKAVIITLSSLGGYYFLVNLLKLFPSIIMDQFYKIVARFRFTLFGRAGNACEILPNNLKKKILN